MILQATHSHLYPGHRGKVCGTERVSDIAMDVDCLVEFSDGSAAAARISKSASGWHLRTGAYRTAAGTDIARKRWDIEFDETAGGLEFRITRKSASG